MKKKVYGYLVWLVATLFVAYAFCLNTAAAVFSEAIKTSLQASNLEASLATGTFILGFACMQIPAGYLLDKFNARYVVSSGILILALGNIMISLSNNLLLFSLSNFLQGVGASFSFIAAAVLISQWFSAKLFPILFGLSQTLSCISAGIIHYYFTLALQIYTWQNLYLALACFGLVLLAVAVIIVKSPDNYKRVKNPSLPHSLALVLKNKQILLCTLAAATSFGVLLTYASFWYMPVQTFYSMDKLQAVVISGMIFVGIGIGTPLLGWISNIVKSRIMVIHASVVLGTIFLLLGIYFPHHKTDTLIIIKIISFLMGFFLSGSMLFYTLVSELASKATCGVAISVLNTAVFLFNSMMIFMPYFLVNSASTEFFTYIWVLPCCILISILLMHFIKDPRP